MSTPAPLNEQERAELVAYLDGELTGDAARAVEARLALDPAARAEAETLRRAWDLLDFLPRPEPSPSFTQRTISRLAPVSAASASGPSTPQPAATSRSRWRLVLVGSWAAALALAAFVGYRCYQRLVPREPGEKELVRDLRLIENKRYYDLVDDFEFLEGLADPALFGDDGGES